MSKDSKLIFYRPEIDSLRAFAVLSVIIFHFKKNLLPGGFLGVDIFFVISGYLITLIFIEEFKEKNSFSFSNFINRRLRRLLPAMLFVIMITIIPSYIFLLPSEFRELINSSFFAIFFSSNFYFNFIDQDYWLNVATTKPLLNLWSLSLEAQFYLFFSLLIYIFFKYFREYFFLFSLIIFFISLIYVFNNSITSNSSSFYLLYARIWEFIPGCLIALYQNKIRSLFNFINDNVFVILSFICFTISFFFYDNFKINTVYYNILAVLGSCLLIIFLQPGTLFYKIITNKILVFIGLISYSLYLIHYPLIIIYRSFYFQMIYSNQNIYEEIIIIFILFFLSIFSYHFVERIFRKKRKISIKKFYIYILISIILIFTISAFFLKQNKDIERSKFDKINIDNNFYSKEYSENFILPFNKINNKKKNLLFIGDSQANNFYMSLALNQNKIKNIELHYINLGSSTFKCLYFFLYDVQNKESSRCDFNGFDFYKNSKDNVKLKDQIYNLINKSDYVFFSKRWNDEDMEYLNRFIKKIKDQNMVFISNANVSFRIIKDKFTPLDISIIMNKKVPTNRKLIELEKKYYEYYESNLGYNKFNNKLIVLANENKIKYFDKVSIQCERTLRKCYVLSDKSNKLIYDIDHFTLEGAKFFGDKIINSTQIEFLNQKIF